MTWLKNCILADYLGNLERWNHKPDSFIEPRLYSSTTWLRSHSINELYFRILDLSCPYQITNCQKSIHLLSLIQLHWFKIMLTFFKFSQKSSTFCKDQPSEKYWTIFNCQKNTCFPLFDKRHFLENENKIIFCIQKGNFELYSSGKTTHQ